MRRSTFFNRREFWIPQGAVKVSDRHSDAVAYLYTTAGRPCARIFYGNQSRPVATYRYSHEPAREAAVRRYFESRQAHQRAVAERRQTPSKTATRNAAIKRVLEATFGRGKVRVTGERGTAYGWVRVTITAAAPADRSAAKSEIERLVLAAGIELGRYDSSDYGSGYELNVSWEPAP